MKRYVWLLDPVTGLVIATSGLLQLWRDPAGGSFHGPTWANSTWMVVLAAAIAIRRRTPLTALIAISVIEVPIQLAWYRHAPQPPFQPFPAILLIVYAVSLSVTETRRRIALALIVAGTAITDIAAFVGGRAFGDVIPAWVFVTLAWLFGRAVSKRQRLADTETQRATRLERERDEASEVAAEAERARIARELHDVITHTVSGIVVQAAVEARAMPDGTTRDVLVSIEHAGREALVELRRLLGVLRHGDAGLSLAPQPGLAQLDSLIDKSQLPAVVRYEGEEIHLPPGVDLSAYRVVQEALTNVRKHALGVNRVDIVVRHSPGGVELEICDDGRPVVPPTTAGFGLIGLRERVALHGGQLHAGAVLPRGYRVWVRLPTVSDAST